MRAARFAATAACAVLAAVVLFTGCGTSTFAPTPRPVIVAFTATPNPVGEGEATQLAWRVTGADSVVILPDIGRVTPPDSGSITLTLTMSATYQLTAYGPGGTSVASLEVHVGSAVLTCGSARLLATSWTATPAAFSNDQARTIEIRGSGFLRNGVQAQVYFGGSLLASTALSDTLLRATVPAAVTPGVYTITIQLPETRSLPLPVPHPVIVTGPVVTGPVVPAVIDHATTLRAVDNPHRMTGAVRVLSGASLTIEPGVVILASTSASLTVLTGASLVMGGGADPAVITDVDGLDRPAHWNAVELARGSGPNVLQNVFLEFGGAASATGLLRVESSRTTLCDVVVRQSASAGVAVALEATGQLAGASGLYLSQNATAGLFLDAGAGGTGGSPAGVVRDNAVGVTYANFTAADCGRWDLSGLVVVANPGGDIPPCP